MAMPQSVVGGEINGWQKVRDDFLQGDPELLQFHCDRGKEANRESVSAFNDVWVNNILCQPAACCAHDVRWPGDACILVICATLPLFNSHDCQLCQLFVAK